MRYLLFLRRVVRFNVWRGALGSGGNNDRTDAQFGVPARNTSVVVGVDRLFNITGKTMTVLELVVEVTSDESSGGLDGKLQAVSMLILGLEGGWGCSLVLMNRKTVTMLVLVIDARWDEGFRGISGAGGLVNGGSVAPFVLVVRVPFA